MSIVRKLVVRFLFFVFQLFFIFYLTKNRKKVFYYVSEYEHVSCSSPSGLGLNIYSRHFKDTACPCLGLMALFMLSLTDFDFIFFSSLFLTPSNSPYALLLFIVCLWCQKNNSFSTFVRSVTLVEFSCLSLSILRII